MVSGRAYDYLVEARQRAAGGAEDLGPTASSTRTTRSRTSARCSRTSRARSRAGPKNVRAYFEHRRQVRARRRDLRLRELELPVRARTTASRSSRSTTCRSSTAARTRPRSSPATRPSSELTKAIVKTKVAGAFHYYITTFFYPPVRKPRTTLHPPILRPRDPAARARAGRAPARLPDVDVERGAAGDPGALRASSAASTACAAISRRTSSRATCATGRSARTGFIDDLRTARGVIASGGFTLMGEAVYLRRPMLAVPIGKPVRAGAERALPRGGGLRPGRRRADARAAGGVPRAPARLRAQARRLPPGAATSSCSQSSTTFWCRQRRHGRASAQAEPRRVRASRLRKTAQRIFRHTDEIARVFSACDAHQERHVSVRVSHFGAATTLRGRPGPRPQDRKRVWLHVCQRRSEQWPSKLPEKQQSNYSVRCSRCRSWRPDAATWRETASPTTRFSPVTRSPIRTAPRAS